tara:strand:+ start:858 stop:1817 length:960 start_codon:yes stop_codon:yes gene_type:complete
MNKPEYKTILNSRFFEINFILFPIWITFFYFFAKSLLPFSDEIIFFIFLFILGESHFASTYLFYFDKSNHKWIKNNSYKMLVIPIMLASIYVIIGFNHLYLALLIGAVMSAIHVTRQSIGIQRLYTTGRNVFFEYNTYFFSFLFIGIGFFRFYYNEIINKFNLPLPYYDENYNKFFIFILLIGLIIALLEKTNYKKILTNLTGVLIYSPYLFVNNIFDAIIIGVGAHWCQYVAINYKVYFYEMHLSKSNLKSIFLIFVIIYALCMSLLGYKTHFIENFNNLLLLIPLTGQFLHYYIDAFIWKFSDEHIRNNIGSKLFLK